MQSDEEVLEELGSESRSFVRYGTCLGGLLFYVSFDVYVTPVGYAWPFDCDGRSFVLSMCYVYRILCTYQ